MPALALQQPMTPYESSGGRLVAADGRTLPLTSAELRAEAKGGLGRTTLIQKFSNPHPEPLAVTYQLPLPADGAVSAFAFEVGGKRIVGEVDKKSAARERFERAILEGQTAALLEQERSSLFTQELGNLPPGAEVVCELVVDQKLAWLREGSWEWRFPTVVAPRYQGAPGRVPDSAKVSVDVLDGPSPVRASFALSIRDRLSAGARPESPSHAIVSRDGELDTAVEPSGEQAVRLDRDVVIRWSVAQPKVGVALDAARAPSGAHAGRAFGLLTVTPPQPSQALPSVGRDLIVLLDTSGSMGGQPLDQARRIVSAMVDTLDSRDHLELIEFSTSPRRWKRGAVEADEKNRRSALEWLAKLQANGGTEMHRAILEALEPLSGESQRQVVLVTDGLIGFEKEVISAILERLPKGSRVHTVGVGSGVNRSLTMPAARAGRGVEVIVGLGEDPERAAKRIVAHTAAPQVVNLELSGTALVAAAPAKLPDLFAGAPTRLSAELRPEGGELVLRGQTADGTFEERVQVAPVSPGTGNAAVATLFAREQVEDLEVQLAAGGPPGELDGRIEALGLAFQISTRLTSWIAVTKEATVDPLAPSRHQRMPQMLPYGMSVEGLGLRAAATGAPIVSTKAGVMRPMMVGRSRGVLGGAPPPTGAPAPAGPTSALHGFAKEADGEAPAKDEQRRYTFHQAARAPHRPAEAEKRKAVPPPRRELRGKRILLENGELVFSFTLEAAASWDPSQRISVRFQDGNVGLFAIDLTKSTRGGELQAGMVVRVSVQVGGGTEPEAVELTLGGETILVRLER